MKKVEYEVSRLTPTEEHAVVASLARAFHNDPMFNFITPDLVLQARGLLRFMQSGVHDARPFGEIWVAHDDGDVAGAAVWLPPGSYPRGTRRDFAQLVRMAPNARGLGSRLPAAMRLLARMDKEHPHEDHWYLAILGVDPLNQRTGAGAALLRPVLERSDTEGLPAYLETQKEANVPWYMRSGFELVQVLDVKGCPPLWTMRREPKST
jgi:GNAT superfamily N-acetyltransferase